MNRAEVKYSYLFNAAIILIVGRYLSTMLFLPSPSPRSCPHCSYLLCLEVINRTRDNRQEAGAVGGSCSHETVNELAVSPINMGRRTKRDAPDKRGVGSLQGSHHFATNLERLPLSSPLQPPRYHHSLSPTLNHRYQITQKHGQLSHHRISRISTKHGKPAKETGEQPGKGGSTSRGTSQYPAVHPLPPICFFSMTS